MVDVYKLERSRLLDRLGKERSIRRKNSYKLRNKTCFRSMTYLRSVLHEVYVHGTIIFTITMAVAVFSVIVVAQVQYNAYAAIFVMMVVNYR